MATQTGTTLAIGAGTITGSYIVIDRTDGDKDTDREDIMDQDGARVTRIVFNNDAKITLSLICKSGAAPETDFAKGGKASHTDFTGYWVEDCRISRSKSAKKADVTLVNIGF